LFWRRKDSTEVKECLKELERARRALQTTGRGGRHPLEGLAIYLN